MPAWTGVLEHLVVMGDIRAVLFDFGDTLFHHADGDRAINRVAASMGYMVEPSVAEALWASIRARARSPQELAMGRDLSPELHRTNFLRLFAEADVIGPGMAEALYVAEIDPGSWEPFADSISTLRSVDAQGVAIGVVSDTGWDIRPVFAAHGVAELIGAWALSYEHGVTKPSPVLFHAACAALGVTPGETLMVGDNPLTDGGGSDAGMPVYLLPATDDQEQRGLGHVVRLLGRP